MKQTYILRMAYLKLLSKREREEKFNDSFKIEHGRESEISLSRISKYDLEIEYVHDMILKAEKTNLNCSDWN